MSFLCKYCTHKPFRSHRGLTQHCQQTRCGRLHDKEHANANPVPSLPLASASLPAVASTPKRFAKRRHKQPQGSLVEDIDIAKSKINGIIVEDQMAWEQLSTPEGAVSSPNVLKQPATASSTLTSTSDNPQPNANETVTNLFPDQEPNDNDLFPDEESINTANMMDIFGFDHNDSDTKPEIIEQADTSIRDQFHQYLAKQQHCAPLDKDQVVAVQLLDLLKRKKAPLNTYEELLEWHLRAKGDLLPGQTLKEHPCFSGRGTFMHELSNKAPQYGGQVPVHYYH